MGWTGTYMSCPKGKDRINEAIKQEGYNFTEQYPDGGYRKSEVIASAMVGTTVYLAVRRIDTQQDIDTVYGAVILTGYNSQRGEFLTKGMDETMGPCECSCPKRVLDLLSPTEYEYAKDWRKRCEEHRKAVNAKAALKRLKEGSKIKLHDNDNTELVGTIHRHRFVFVDYLKFVYYTPAQVYRIGYDVI